MKHNYFVFCTMITLFCFSTIAMEQPSKKDINHRVFMAIEKLQGPPNEVLEYVETILEKQYLFQVTSTHLTKPTTNESEKRTDKIEL